MFWFSRLSADFPGRPNRPRHPAHFVSNNLWGHRVELFFHWVMRKPWQQARPIPTGLGRGGFSTHANETGQIWYITLRWTDQRLILENISIRYIIGGTFGSGLCTMKRQLWSYCNVFIWHQRLWLHPMECVPTVGQRAFSLLRPRPSIPVTFDREKQQT